jgi:hypothetical protein
LGFCEPASDDVIRLLGFADNSESVLNRNNGWVFFPDGKYNSIRLDVFIEQLGYAGGESVLVEQITLPWVEQQGIPQEDYPALTGKRWLCY